ncbi:MULTISPECIES: hypothetical protein [unclassified Microbacterium]|uniref:glycosyltransferase family protein n=1 Tax=unclassified Microbacterium TaxID=2609290 RepID=UPI00214B05EE|nr:MULTISPECIES: hypothetical protein [unclassified Microbacterium]MCR2784791.1 hypothetical protein [Microbacterium sp. zg.B96]WIM16330.1 hypothetical protein QNO11_01480 [Microbacterium sp. zg-B96]
MIAPSFFGYEEAIAGEIRAQGHEVDLVDERPSNAPLARAIVRVAPFLLRGRIRRHFAALLARTQATPPDLVLVIKGEVVPEWFLTTLRWRSPTTRFVYYTFDSSSNSPRGITLLPLFDRAFSFDPVDARRRPSVAYLPLFYRPEFHPGEAPRDLDLSFVGTLHGDRHAFVHAVAAAVPPERRILFFYSPAAWYFWARKLLSARYRGIPRSAIRTTPLTIGTVADTMRRSKAVVDLQRPGQTGLTMRTFEVLASGAALITANGSIRDEYFHDPARVLVVPAEASRVNPAVVAAFIEGLPARGTTPPGFEDHSLAAWTSTILESARVEG